MAYNNNYGNRNYNKNYSNNNYGNKGTAGVPQQKKKDEISTDVTTDGILLYNKSEGIFMKTGFWNHCMTISIGRFNPNEALNISTINNAQTAKHTFSFSSACEFRDVCMDVLEAIKTAGTFESMAIEAGTKNKSILEISNGSNIGRAPGLYFVSYQKLDQMRRTDNMEVYPFVGTKVYYNYDHSTGQAKEDVRNLGEFKKFVTCLDEGCKALTMAHAYSVMEANKTNRLTTFMGLAAIAANLGIDFNKVTKPSSNKTSYNNSNNTSPQDYQRKSQSWNNPNNTISGGSYQNTYNTPSTPAPQSEPTDITIDSSQLRDVTMGHFSLND